MRSKRARPVVEATYPVERIVSRRERQPAGTEYLIKWKGYQSEDNTWEPADHLPGLLVDAYNKRRCRARPASKDGATAALAKEPRVEQTPSEGSRNSGFGTGSNREGPQTRRARLEREDGSEQSARRESAPPGYATRQHVQVRREVGNNQWYDAIVTEARQPIIDACWEYSLFYFDGQYHKNTKDVGGCIRTPSLAPGYGVENFLGQQSFDLLEDTLRKSDCSALLKAGCCLQMAFLDANTGDAQDVGETVVDFSVAHLAVDEEHEERQLVLYQRKAEQRTEDTSAELQRLYQKYLLDRKLERFQQTDAGIHNKLVHFVETCVSKDFNRRQGEIARCIGENPSLLSGWVHNNLRERQKSGKWEEVQDRVDKSLLNLLNSQKNGDDEEEFRPELAENNLALADEAELHSEPEKANDKAEDISCTRSSPSRDQLEAAVQKATSAAAAENARLEAEVTEAKRSAAEDKTQFEAEKAQLEAEKAQLQAEVAESKSSAAAAKTRFEAEKAQFEAALAQANSLVAAEKTNLEAALTLAREKAQLEAEVAEANRSAAVEKSQFEAKKAQLEAAVAEANSAAAAEMAQLEGEKAQLEASVAQANSAAAAEKAQLEATSAVAQARLESANGELARTRAALVAAERAAHDLTQAHMKAVGIMLTVHPTPSNLQ